MVSILENPLTLKSLSSDRNSDRPVHIYVDFSQSTFIYTKRSRQRLAREPVKASFLKKKRGNIYTYMVTEEFKDINQTNIRKN